MSTDSYKLTYFDGRGLAEVSRLLFAAAGVAFTDDRFPSDDDRKTWLALKPLTPFLKVPILNVNGTVIPQSKAIERFLARRFGFYGSSDIESALVDAAVEEVRDGYQGYYTNKNDAEKLKAFVSGDLRKSLENLNKFSTPNGYFVGNKISYADITLFNFVGMVDKETADALLSGLDNLQKIRATVENNDRIKAYVAKRKPTPF